MTQSPRKLALSPILALIVGVAIYYFFPEREKMAAPVSETVSEPQALPPETRSQPYRQPELRAPSNEAVLAAYGERAEGRLVDATGSVTRVLPDDSEGSRHQRFLIRVAPQLTLLVAHNIDLAPRVPIREGDTVALRGDYEYNDKGGVLHWTHRDPRGHHPDGWIEHEGRRYE